MNILAECNRRGIRIEADGAALKVDAPKGALTENLLALLKEHKAELLLALQSEDLREHFEERAGILEYDAGLPRSDAELEAARITATYAASGTQDGVHAADGTQQVRNDGAPAEANENATYARTQPFRGDPPDNKPEPITPESKQVHPELQEVLEEARRVFGPDVTLEPHQTDPTPAARVAGRYGPEPFQWVEPRPIVRCGDCQHFARDTVGDGWDRRLRCCRRGHGPF